LIIKYIKANKKGFLIIIGVIITWIIFLVFGYPKETSLKCFASLGDSFNILTSLFTGLAFAFVVISVTLQKKELEETREEFKGQREALEHQQFDNKFFQMLNVFNNVVETIKSHSEDKKILFQKEVDIKTRFREFTVDSFIEKYEEYNDSQSNSKYYFLNLYQVLKYIDKYAPNNKKKEYSNIVRAQLSRIELIALFYNCIGVLEISGNKYKKLVEEYSFFEHLTYNDLIYFDGTKNPSNEKLDNKLLIDYLLLQYNKNAYGDSKSILNKIKELESCKICKKDKSCY